MVSWMYNNAKDVKTEIDSTLRVSLAFLALLVKLENNNEKDAMAQRTKVSGCISPEFSIVPLNTYLYLNIVPQHPDFQDSEYLMLGVTNHRPPLLYHVEQFTKRALQPPLRIAVCV